jgi:hypothetical protein
MPVVGTRLGLNGKTNRNVDATRRGFSIDYSRER